MKPFSSADFLSPMARQIPPSGIRKFFDLVDGSEDIVSLGVGEPDFVTPQVVRDAAIAALQNGRTSYTSNAGLYELREAIAEYVSARFKLNYEPANEVLVTVGSSEAIDLALRVLISPGDEILVPDPSYISYSPITQLSGGVAVPIPTDGRNQFKLTAEALAGQLTDRSKVLVLCFPNNPTGSTMTYEEWLPIAKLVEERNLVVISDEIYAELTYGANHASFASLPGMRERTIHVSGFSKAFAMTGWRMGYACGPRELIAAMLKVHQYTVMCAPIAGQIASLTCLRHGMEEKDRMIEEYNRRRLAFVEGLRQIGLPCHEPMGAFYAFPSIAHTGLSSEQFAERLLREGRVATVPGHVFGLCGEGYIRCSYAAQAAKLDEALDRMHAFMKQLDIQAAPTDERLALKSS